MIKKAGLPYDLFGWYDFPDRQRSHSGRTDADYGHNDYQNMSGLGNYHWHHGWGPHLHPCNMQGESLINLLSHNGASVFTTKKISSEGTTYVFEAVIILDVNKKRFSLEITGKQETDGFYITDNGEKTRVEPFWGTDLRPKAIIKKDSP